MKYTLILGFVLSVIMGFVGHCMVNAQEEVVNAPLPCVVIEQADRNQLEQRINYWKFERNYDFQVVNAPRHWEYLIIATCRAEVK